MALAPSGYGRLRVCIRILCILVQEWVQPTLQPDKATLIIPTEIATKSVHIGETVLGVSCDVTGSSTLPQSVIALFHTMDLQVEVFPVQVGHRYTFRPSAWIQHALERDSICRNPTVEYMVRKEHGTCLLTNHIVDGMALH